MQPPQTLHHRPDLLHIREALNHLLLDLGLQVQEPLNELPIHEAFRLARLAHVVLEGPVGVELDVAGAVDEFGKVRLQADEEVLVLVVYEREEVD